MFDVFFFQVVLLWSSARGSVHSSHHKGRSTLLLPPQTLALGFFGRSILIFFWNFVVTVFYELALAPRWAVVRVYGEKLVYNDWNDPRGPLFFSGRFFFSSRLSHLRLRLQFIHACGRVYRGLRVVHPRAFLVIFIST